MKQTFQSIAWLLFALLVLSVVAMPGGALAQDDQGDDDFGDEAAAGEASGQSAAPVSEPSPAFKIAAQAIVDSDPSEPVDLTMAVVNLLQFERPDLAKRYFDKLVAIPMEPGQQAELGEAVGSDVLARLINSPHLGPEAAPWGQEIQLAWGMSLRDPERLSELAEKALSDDRQERALAMVELKRGGMAGIQPLLLILADGDRGSDHSFAREALISYGAPAAAPLIAALETSNLGLKQNITRVLAQINKDKTARYLYADAWAGENEAVRQTAQKAVRMLEGRATPAHEARPMLLKMSRGFISGERRVDVHADGSADTWFWNDRDNQLVFKKSHPAVIAAHAGARLARDLFRLSPNDAEAQLWFQVCALQVLKMEIGLDKPLPENQLSAVPLADDRSKAVQLSEVLGEALKRKAAAAAIAAAELIAQTREAAEIQDNLLIQADGRPAPLALALRHADRRVQLAAANAIVAMERSEGFVGAGALIGVLRPLANYSGIRRAVVADPRGNRTDQLAALLAEQGFEARGYTTGRGLFQAAIASGENELALITYTIDKPDVRRLIEHLRNDARTAHLPIGIVVDPDKRFEASVLADKYSMVQAFVRPRDAAAMQLRVNQLLGGSGLAYVPPAVRTQQAMVALSLLDKLTLHPSPYDLRDLEPAVANALFHPTLAPLAAKVLGQIRSHKAQAALVEYASQNAQPVASRQAAVKGFADSLQRHGVLLNYDEIKKQTVRYDDSEGLEQETQDVLWSILDALQTVKKKRPQSPVPAPRDG